MKWIKFKGKKYLLVDDMNDGGPIATKKQYQYGECSYAHLERDRVMRNGKQIGTKGDIEIIGKADIKPKIGPFELMGKFMDMDSGWRY